MTNPATSSSMAALDKITPSRLLSSPLVRRMVNVVPRDVEHNAAPEANAWTGVAFTNFSKMNDRPMGVATPIRATVPEKWMFAHNVSKSVDRPPGIP